MMMMMMMTSLHQFMHGSTFDETRMRCKLEWPLPSVPLQLSNSKGRNPSEQFSSHKRHVIWISRFHWTAGFSGERQFLQLILLPQRAEMGADRWKGSWFQGVEFPSSNFWCFILTSFLITNWNERNVDLFIRSSRSSYAHEKHKLKNSSLYKIKTLMTFKGRPK